MTRFAVWIVILGSIPVFGSSDEEYSCEMQAISKKYEKSCGKTYVDDIFKDGLADGKMKPDEFLELLSSACSNYEFYMKCVNCTARHVCPEEEAKFKEVLISKWQLFCDEDQPAAWLSTILQNQYSYTRACDAAFNWEFRSCTQVEPPEHLANATSLTGVTETYRFFITKMFKCSVAEVIRFVEDADQCDSTWQDILLTNWLMFSAKHGIGVDISKEDVEMLKAMRCGEEATVSIRQVLRNAVP